MQEKKYIHKSCDDRRLVHPREACEWRIRILTPSEEDDDFYTWDIVGVRCLDP